MLYTSRMDEPKPVSTAADFRQHAADNALEPEEAVTLPSGLKVMLRRPTSRWWLLNRGTLPSSLANRFTDAPREDLTDEQLLDYSRFIVRLVEIIVVNPRVKRNPGENEVDPDWITNEDLTFLIHYAGGETTAAGQNLSTFRGGGDAATSGTHGEGMELPAEQLR
jgi:hypothetical protein